VPELKLKALGRRNKERFETKRKEIEKEKLIEKIKGKKRC